MKLSLEQKTNLVSLGEKASDLLVKIIDEELPKSQQSTKTDIKLKEVLSQIYKICPLLSDSHILMYNYIQEQKISSRDTYYKRLRKS